MNFWIYFWTVFFFASLAVFAGVAIVVSIGGFFDVRSLFKSLSTGSDEQAGTVSWQDESEQS
ncbi:MAG: hypothetical protein JSW66_16940 [Phycisphaerales bacterium]|nr:MAG: hypothetical protein JSW66_16940 [Phycisphaerales bacterium]